MGNSVGSDKKLETFSTWQWDFSLGSHLAMECSHIAQNIAETCQKYFQPFIAIEILSQHFYQILQNILPQRYNFNILKYF